MVNKKNIADFKITRVEDYEKFIGAEAVSRIIEKSDRLKDLKVININSTYYGGGVAEILNSLTLLMNTLGIKTEWRVIKGTPDFFTITKKMHNALQGGEINLSKLKKEIYELVIYENVIRNYLDHDIVIIHDPQPLPMIKFYDNNCTWIWRCHIDLTETNMKLWLYLGNLINKYDAVILSSREYAKKIIPPIYYLMPAINPFNIKNRDLSEKEMMNRLNKYKIPTDLPLVVQVSRFDKWKGQKAVVEAFKSINKEVKCTLVFLGNFADDDPEGSDYYHSLSEEKDERIIVLPYGNDTALVNTLQKKAHVVIQYSIREGFGLTVTEAMWKGTPVIGGNVGGIKYQIRNGENGYLVSSVDELADRIAKLLKDDKLREEMGKKARESVKQNFLMTRYLEQYLDLFTEMHVNKSRII